MKQLQKDFLSQFDQQIRKYIIEFCKRFTRENYDVYILLARKAACFLTVLEDLEIITFNGTVVSDRVLEYDTSWLSGKRVAVIDDTIISGTSIYKIVMHLKEIGVASVSVHAFCIDDYWFVEDLLKNEGECYLREPYMQVSHTSSIRFCRQIVNALSIVPRPYNIDFPVCEVGRFSKQQLLTLIEDDSWNIIRTTTHLQESFGVESASLNFKENLFADFNASLGCDLGCLYFAKMRLFFKEISDESSQSNVRYTCKAVPFVMFNPISIDFANTIVEAICKSEGVNEEQLKKELCTAGARLLFIQYYLAIKLFKWWSSTTGELLNKIFENKVNKRSLNLLFSPSLLDIIDGFSYTEKLQIEQSVVETEIQLTEKHKEKTYNIVKGGLTSQFLNLYYTKELPARRKVRKDGRKAFTEKEYTNIINRLNDGLSVSDLIKCVPTDILSSSEKMLYLSTFLDFAIDKGIIVPITRVRNNRLCRAFRHGEEVIWGDTNDKMLALFFKELTNGSNNISKLIFEKMLVIFLKIGLRMDFLDEYNVEEPVELKTNMIGIRSYLFGQVSEFYAVKPLEYIDKSPILDPDTRTYWTSHRLQNLGLIIDDNNSGFQLQFDKMDSAKFAKYMDKGEASDIDPDIESNILTMADIFKACLDNKFLTSDGLVDLTSCINPHDNTASLGAELTIFSRQLNQYLNKIDGAIHFGNLSVELLKELRHSNDKKGTDTLFLWTAVNSGKDKYFTFKLGEGITLIDDIALKLKPINRLASREWERYWRKDKELYKTCDPELNELNENMGILLIDIRITLICQHILLYVLLQRNKMLDKYMESLQKEISFLDIEINAIQDQEENSKIKLEELRKRKKNLTSEIKTMSDYVKNNIDSINNDLNKLDERQQSLLKSVDLFSFVSNESLSSCDDEEIIVKIKECKELLNVFKDDTVITLTDFSALVPQWGKLRKTVRYNSLLHINSSSNNITVRSFIGDIVKAELANFEIDEFGENSMNKSIVLLRIDNEKTGGKGYILAAKGQRHDERLLKLGCNILKRSFSQKLNVTLALLPDFDDCEVKAYFNPQTNLFDRVKENLYLQMPHVNENHSILISTESERKNIVFYNNALVRYNLYDNFKIEQLNTNKNKNRYKLKMEKRKKKIFISYSRKDVEYKEEVISFLKPLKLADIVETWCCEQIIPGQWDDQIQTQLEQSDIIVFLLSNNFFGSSYILENEVSKILKGKSKKSIICLIVSKFTNLDKISEFITNNFKVISDRQKAFMEVNKFQFLPYGRVINRVNNQVEEQIVPLKDYANVTNLSIEAALSQLTDKILQII